MLGPGGKGSNQSVASAMAGAETHFITRLGRDAFGEMALAVWAKAGVARRVAAVASRSLRFKVKSPEKVPRR